MIIQVTDTGTGKYYGRYKRTGQWRWRYVSFSHIDRNVRLKFKTPQEAFDAVEEAIREEDTAAVLRAREGLVVREEIRP